MTTDTIAVIVGEMRSLSRLGYGNAAIANKISELADRLAALGDVEKDAARYRFIRTQHEGDDPVSFCVFRGVHDAMQGMEPVGSVPGELDAAIDAANSPPVFYVTHDGKHGEYPTPDSATDTKRLDWLAENVTERLTDASTKGEYSAEHKTQYEFPKLIAWADFCGQITLREAIDAAMQPKDQNDD
jgi:hypothetical protein